MEDGMGTMHAAPPPSAGANDGRQGHKMAMHMTFFWGENVQILFSGWPGDRGVGIYLLALLAVFALSAAADCLSVVSERLNRSSAGGGRGGVSTPLLLTGVHAVRTALHYLVMLAVMSFNVGVLIAAVAGHAAGFLLSGSGLLARADAPGGQLRGRPAPKV